MLACHICWGVSQIRFTFAEIFSYMSFHRYSFQMSLTTSFFALFSSLVANTECEHLSVVTKALGKHEGQQYLFKWQENYYSNEKIKKRTKHCEPVLHHILFFIIDRSNYPQRNCTKFRLSALCAQTTQSSFFGQGQAGVVLTAFEIQNQVPTPSVPAQHVFWRQFSIWPIARGKG